MNAKLNRLLWDLLLVAALLVVSLVMFGHFLFGRIPISGDMTLFYAPFYSIAWDGGLPLWNPHEAAGLPMDGNLQFSALYPLRLPFYFIDDWRSYFSLYFFLHYIIAIVGAVGTLRAFGFGRLAQFGGAIAFACGGYMVGRMINSTICLSSCWFPWLVWGLAERRAFGGVIVATGIAMILLLGSPHLMAYGTIGFAVAWIALGPGWYAVRGESGVIRKGWGAWFMRWVFFALGVGIGVVNVIPAIEPIRRSIREETTIENNLEDSLRWDELTASFFGGGGGNIYPENNDKTLYVGGSAIFFIILAAITGAAWADRRWWCGLALALAGLAIALGSTIGWQYVLPYVWGLNLLEGPARALVLTAFGLALMVGFGIDRMIALRYAWRAAASAIAFGLSIAAIVILVMGWPEDWSFPRVLWGYLAAPGSAIGFTYTLVNSAVVFLLAGVAALLFRSRPIVAPVVLVALLAIQLLHFAPRVNPQTVAPEAFDPPSSVQFLIDRQQTESFRFASFDVFRFHHTEMDSLYKVDYLMANLGTLYGLQDISAFDPLVPRAYKQLFEETSGIPEFNDPIRHIDPARPDEELFKKLGVRYLIGNPYDRRLTTEPATLSPNSPFAPVAAWDDAGTSEPLSAWHFVSLVSGNRAEMGEPIARLVVSADEGRFEFPVRYGIETAHVEESEAALETMQARPNMKWRLYPGPGGAEFRIPQTNYRATIDFGRPLHVRSARWELLRPDLALHVQMQGYRLAAPESDEAWRLAHDNPRAPVYEFFQAKPMVELLDEQGKPIEAEIRETLREANRIHYEVASAGGGLLLMRESWAPGWMAIVNGRETEVLKIDEIFRGLDLRYGTNRIEMIYRPEPFYLSLAVSIASLLILLLVFALTSGRAKQ